MHQIAKRDLILGPFKKKLGIRKFYPRTFSNTINIIPPTFYTVPPPKSFKLNNNTEIPSIGYGTFKNKENIKYLIKAAIEKGYRQIDTASYYGNEEEIGEAIRESISSKIVTREELFITTKIFNNEKMEGNVGRALQGSLRRLGLSYVDMYLIHWPLGDLSPTTLTQTPLHKTWLEMEKCVENNLTRGIGMSNAVPQLLLDLLTYARIPPAVLQVEMNPYLQQPDLLKFCKMVGIQVMAYAPLGAVGNAGVLGYKGEVRDCLGDEVVMGVAGNYGKLPAQVMLNWGITRGTVVLPKTANLQRLGENLDVLDFQLSTTDMENIDALDIGQRIYDPRIFWNGIITL